jgi:hypothetical protein
MRKYEVSIGEKVRKTFTRFQNALEEVAKLSCNTREVVKLRTVTTDGKPRLLFKAKEGKILHGFRHTGTPRKPWQITK